MKCLLYPIHENTEQYENTVYLSKINEIFFFHESISASKDLISLTDRQWPTMHITTHTISNLSPTYRLPRHCPLQRGKKPEPCKCPGYNTKLHVMVKLRSWSLGLILITLSLPLLPGPLSYGLAALVRISSRSQIEYFNYLLRIIIIGYLKPNNYVQIIDIT